jgi:integrase
MPSINFFLQTVKNPAPIYVRVRDGKIDAKAKTNYFINPEQWSTVKKQPKNLKDAESKSILTGLNDIKALITNSLNVVDTYDGINSEWLMEVLNPAKEEDMQVKNILLADHFDLYYKEKIENEAKLSMLKKTMSVKALVLKYQHKLKKPILLTEVDVAWMNDFMKFMNAQKYKQSYTFRVVKFIKSVCFHAKALGIETSRNFEQIQAKDRKAFKTYLSEEEIQKIIEAKMPTESLENARDWLVISCYLGQRVSDLMRCKKSLIKKVGNYSVIDITQKKTDLPIMVAIFPEVERFLEKRNGEFPREISAQRYNEYIKEVCKIAGLTELEKGTLHDGDLNRGIDGIYPKWQLITSHVGRRSFATNFYSKYPTALLMAQTGHSTERAFLEYIGKGRVDQITQLLEMVFKK